MIEFYRMIHVDEGTHSVLENHILLRYSNDKGVYTEWCVTTGNAINREVIDVAEYLLPDDKPESTAVLAGWIDGYYKTHPDRRDQRRSSRGRWVDYQAICKLEQIPDPPKRPEKEKDDGVNVMNVI